MAAVSRIGSGARLRAALDQVVMSTGRVLYCCGCRLLIPKFPMPPVMRAARARSRRGGFLWLLSAN